MRLCESWPRQERIRFRDHSLPLRTPLLPAVDSPDTKIERTDKTYVDALRKNLPRFLIHKPSALDAPHPAHENRLGTSRLPRTADLLSRILFPSAPQYPAVLSSGPVPGPWHFGRNVLYCEQTCDETRPDSRKDEKTSARLLMESSRSEERRVGKECRSRWSPYH